MSSKSSRPTPVFAETATIGTSPPYASTSTFDSARSLFTRSGFASGLSTLFMATMIGTFAARAWLIASFVCGITPSSAATTMMAMSVTRAPRARIAVNASWPGVSRKRMLRSPRFTRLAPRCCVIPPRSPAATVVFRSASRRLVFPWSTCPMTVTIGARVSSAAVADSSKRICLVAAGGASGASVGASSTSSGSGSATLNPSSVAISAAVSRSIPWFMVAKTPLRIRGLMMSAGLTRRICASSPTVIDGGSTRIPVS